MRVLIVCEGLWGGSGRVVSWLANRLSGSGHDVSLLVEAPASKDCYALRPQLHVGRVVRCRSTGAAHLPQKNELTSKGISAFGRLLRPLIGRVSKTDFAQFCRVGVKTWRMAISVRSYSGRFDPDAVVAFVRGTNIAVLLGLMGTRLPVVVSERSDPFAYKDLGLIRRHLRPWLYRKAAAVVVLTEQIALEASQTWGVKKAVVIPNAPFLKFDRRLPDMDSRPKVVVFVGRLHHHKDPTTLLRAWSFSKARYFGWTLRFVGVGQLLETLMTESSDLQLGQSIEFRGNCEDVSGELLAARIFVLPSILEGFSNALIEAMAAGCACIATDCPGATADILGHGQFGILVPMKSPKELAIAIDRLIDDDSLCMGYGQASIARSSDFDPEQVFGMWQEVLLSASVRHSFSS